MMRRQTTLNSIVIALSALDLAACQREPPSAEERREQVLEARWLQQVRAFKLHLPPGRWSVTGWTNVAVGPGEFPLVTRDGQTFLLPEPYNINIPLPHALYAQSDDAAARWQGMAWCNDRDISLEISGRTVPINIGTYNGICSISPH